MPWLFGIVLLARPSLSANVSWVRGPEEYVALSEDLVVRYGLARRSPAATVQVVDSRGTVLAETRVPGDSASGRLVFPCGTVHRAGDYSFRLVDGDGPAARSSETTRVLWPRSVAHVPLLLETYGSDAVVAFEFPGVECAPLPGDDSAFVASLVYGGRRPGSRLRDVVAEVGLPSWKALLARHVTFDCELFDRAGFYQVRLTCADDEKLPVVSESVPVSVLWSSRYALDVAQRSVSGCRDGISVVYHYPTTCSGGRDKVRVYGRRANSSHFRYLLERRLPENRHALTLGCHFFEEGFDEFCFVYVSVARGGAVFELRRACRPWNLDPGASSPSWGTWSEWSGCTGSCGEGVRIRYRLCGGRAADCPGSAYDVRNCALGPCPEPSVPGTTEAASVHCSCGCSLTVFRRERVRYRPPCGNPVTWVLRPLLEPRVTVRLWDARLRPDGQRVTVREGESPVDPLLAVVAPPDPRPLLVTSRKGPLRVDLLDENGTAPSDDDDDLGFEMAFWETGAPPRPASPLRAGAPLPSVHVAFVVVGGAVLCTIFALAATYNLHRHRRRGSRAESACSAAEDDPAVGLLRKSVTLTSEVSLEVASKAAGRSPGDRAEGGGPFESVASLRVPTPGTPKAAPPPGASPDTGGSRASGRTFAEPEKKAAASSVSEPSASGTEDGFELDYYDYAWHDLPGSFFCSPGWPPFLPQPGEEDDALELQLQRYSLPPPETDLGD